MLTITIVLPLLLTGTALAQNPNPITPAETAKSVGKRVTVEFVAKRALCHCTASAKAN